jgi:hypothetical protein
MPPRPRPHFDAPVLRVEPWVDPVVDQLGLDPRSAYVERFWLSILGPSTVLLLRRLAAGFDLEPDGFDLELPAVGVALGLGGSESRHSAIARTLGRACQFDLARPVDRATVAVRRRIPPLTRGQIVRLPADAQADHERWLADQRQRPLEPEPKRRARVLALSLVQLGEDLESTERQLHRWRVHPALAYDAAQWAWQEHHRDRQLLTTTSAPAGP